MIFHRLMIKGRREVQPNPLPHVFPMGNLRSENNENDENYEVIGIPFLNDNYAYVIKYQVQNTNGESESRAVAVDPADAEAVGEYLKQQNVKLSTILTTHKYRSHLNANN